MVDTPMALPITTETAATRADNQKNIEMTRKLDMLLKTGFWTEFHQDLIHTLQMMKGENYKAKKQGCRSKADLPITWQGPKQAPAPPPFWWPPAACGGTTGGRALVPFPESTQPRGRLRASRFTCAQGHSSLSRVAMALLASWSARLLTACGTWMVAATSGANQGKKRIKPPQNRGYTMSTCTNSLGCAGPKLHGTGQKA